MSSPLRDYEMILISHPELGEEALSKLQAQFGDVVTRHGGQVLEWLNLGKRKLTYRIKRLSEGIYLQVRLRIPPGEVAGLEKSTSLIEPIVRFLVVQGSTVPGTRVPGTILEKVPGTH